MTAAPAWVLEQIATRTGADPRQGRAARAATCPRCRAHVLRGPDDDMCAFTAQADPHRLTPLGELQAVLAGRPTYDLTGRPPALTYRHNTRIRHRPPSSEFTVLAEHECAAPALDTYPDIPARRAKKGAAANEPAPF